MISIVMSGGTIQMHDSDCHGKHYAHIFCHGFGDFIVHYCTKQMVTISNNISHAKIMAVLVRDT